MKSTTELCIKMMKSAGVEVEDVKESMLTDIIEGTATADNGAKFEVACGTNGCLRIVKPNGKVKYYYDKSLGQAATIIKQVRASYSKNR